MTTVETAMPDRGRPWRLALIGANGMLARKVAQLAPAGIEVIGYDLPEFDITVPAMVREALCDVRPELVVNCAAYTAVDRCESEEAPALAVNGTAVGTLAAVARECGSLLLHISTDYVFDGRGATAYVETDAVGPLSAYGRTKLAGERAITEAGLQRALIVRTSWLHGPEGKNFVATILRLAGEREELRVVADQVGSPTFTGDLAKAIFVLLGAVLNGEGAGRQDLYGIYHFANAGQCSWQEFAVAIVAEAQKLGAQLAVQQVVSIATADYPLPAPRPAWSVLSTQRFRSVCGCEVPHWQDGLRRHLAELFADGRI